MNGEEDYGTYTLGAGTGFIFPDPTDEPSLMDVMAQEGALSEVLANTDVADQQAAASQRILDEYSFANAPSAISQRIADEAASYESSGATANDMPSSNFLDTLAGLASTAFKFATSWGPQGNGVKTLTPGDVTAATPKSSGTKGILKGGSLPKTVFQVSNQTALVVALAAAALLLMGGKGRVRV